MKTKGLLLGGVGLLFAGVAAMCWAQAPACTASLEPGQRADVEVKRGETFSVCLSLSAGTGYTWQLQSGTDAKVVEIVGEPVFEAARQLPGARGHLRFVLRATVAGRSTLTFRYLPPGQPASESASLALSIR
jgi:predicted secreted protein